MYDDWVANAMVAAGALVAAALCVGIHYEFLNLLSRGLADIERGNHRRKVLHGVFGVLGVHLVEVWVFGLAYWLLLKVPGTGHVAGADPLGLPDAVYMAVVCFTTVGFGDLVPVGPIRFLAGTTSLIGLVLITWSASFTYLGMERYWKR